MFKILLQKHCILSFIQKMGSMCSMTMPFQYDQSYSIHLFFTKLHHDRYLCILYLYYPAIPPTMLTTTKMPKEELNIWLSRPLICTKYVKHQLESETETTIFRKFSFGKVVISNFRKKSILYLLKIRKMATTSIYLTYYDHFINHKKYIFWWRS